MCKRCGCQEDQECLDAEPVIEEPMEVEDVYIAEIEEDNASDDDDD